MEECGSAAQCSTSKPMPFAIGAKWSDVFKDFERLFVDDEINKPKDNEVTDLSSMENLSFSSQPIDEIFEGYECLYEMTMEDGAVKACGDVVKCGFVGDHFKHKHPESTEQTTPTLMELMRQIASDCSRKSNELYLCSFDVLQKEQPHKTDNEKESSKKVKKHRKHKKERKKLVEMDEDDKPLHELFVKEEKKDEIKDEDVFGDFDFLMDDLTAPQTPGASLTFDELESDVLDAEFSIICDRVAMLNEPQHVNESTTCVESIVTEKIDIQPVCLADKFSILRNVLRNIDGEKSITATKHFKDFTQHQKPPEPDKVSAGFIKFEKYDTKNFVLNALRMRKRRRDEQSRSPSNSIHTFLLEHSLASRSLRK